MSMKGIGLVDVIDHDPTGAWLALGLLPGPGFIEWARDRPLEVVSGAVLQLANAVAGLHAAGISHGDIKPDNILMDGMQNPRLLDLGLCAPTPTTDGFHGSLGTASPEQFRGAGPTPESDVFALGVVLYEALTGTPPFAGEGRAQVLAPTKRLPLPPAAHRPGLPRDIGSLLLTMLDRRPTHRPAAAEVGAAFHAGRVSAPQKVHPAIRPHWSAASGALLDVVDRSETRILVVHGTDPSARQELIAALCHRAEAEGLVQSAHASGGLFLLDGPDAASHAEALAGSEAPALILVSHPGPLPELVALGAEHLQTGAGTRTVEPSARALLDALDDGPRTLDALKEALGMGAHDILDLADPLLAEGALVEIDGGARLGRGPR